MRIEYDHSVRGLTGGSVFQFIYGYNGFDPSAFEVIDYTILTLNNKEMEENYKWTAKNTPLMDKEFKSLMEDRDFLRDTIAKDKTIPIASLQTYMPFNIHRIVENITFLNEDDGSAALTPDEVIKDVDILCAELIRLYFNNLVDIKTILPPIVLEMYEKSLRCMKIFIRIELASRKIIEHYKCTRNRLVRLWVKVFLKD
jgi:hypothetical protein